MKNKSNDGILCDYCGDESRGDFIYYSFDFKRINVNDKGFTSELEALEHSVDLCERCTELFRQRLLDVAEKVPESPNRCDVSGGCFPKRNSSFLKCLISKVTVNISGQPYICASCDKSRQPSEGPCECGDGDKLIREAKVDVDPRYLELNFMEETFQKFKKHVNFIQGLGESEWTNQQ